MSSVAQFFLQHIDVVFFFYGLSFFCMGLAILLESSRSAARFEFARALRPLGYFGVIHGSHEWFEMFLILDPDINDTSCSNWIAVVRIILLAISFIFLVGFGAILISDTGNKKTQRLVLLVVSAVWAIGFLAVLLRQPYDVKCLVSADVYTRYALAIPGAILASGGLVLQRKRFLSTGLPGFGNDVTIAAIALLLYGAIGQLFASPSAIFPSYLINTDTFIQWFGFPVQVFRAMMATIVAIFMIRSLRANEVENQRRIEALREAQAAERQRFEALRAELFHRTVRAQEAERQRIARELHDETGQTLTGLGMGLRALAENIPVDPNLAMQQARQLEKLATDGIEALDRMVRGLHPPQLDDLGLMAALRWYADEMSRHSQLHISVQGKGNDQNLPPDVRVVFFRIAQEAITNIIRHAKATQASVELTCTEGSCFLRVEDNGCGFVVEEMLKNTTKPPWGLMGMQERAALIQGNLVIESLPGHGTLVMLDWQRSNSHG